MLRRCAFGGSSLTFSGGSRRCPSAATPNAAAVSFASFFSGRGFSSMNRTTTTTTTTNSTSGASATRSVTSMGMRWCSSSTPAGASTSASTTNAAAGGAKKKDPPMTTVYSYDKEDLGSATATATGGASVGGDWTSGSSSGDTTLINGLPSEASLTRPYQQSYKNRSVSNWLLFTAWWVSGVILVGAITRLTESGLSIVKWKPLSGIKPPMNPEEWQDEFEQYLRSVEGQQRGATMSMEEFKFIFFWEWFHRVLARGIGVVFAGPLLYFAARGHLKKATPRFKYLGLGGLVVLGGCQGAMGWYMVKSGLDKNLLDAKTKATVSAYRLAAHLTLAMTIFSTMLAMAFSLRVPVLPQGALKSKGYAQFKRVAFGTTGLMFLTATSGAFVAGLDAGLLYNDTFPLMGEGICPPWADLTTTTPLWRNILENPSASQLFHRLMAGTTTIAIIGLNLSARRSGFLLAYPHVKRSIYVINGALVVQITLGVSALLTYVKTEVAASHQAGAITLLTTLLYLCAILTSKGRIL